MQSVKTDECDGMLIGHHLSTPDTPIDNLPVKRSIEYDCCIVTSFWKPSDEQLVVLARGGYVTLEVLGHTHPPVRLDVTPRIR